MIDTLDRGFVTDKIWAGSSGVCCNKRRQWRMTMSLTQKQ
jgi:hypothetical protein